MKSYLKIENPGVAPTEAFTLLGASTKGGSGGNTIGQFGSGNKHGVNVCLRHDLQPVVFCGNLKLEFGVRSQEVNDGLAKKSFDRVFVKFGGKDEQGRQRSSNEDLGYVLDYGAHDWHGIELALREFVSNSIDRAIDEDRHKFIVQYFQTHLNSDDQSLFNQGDSAIKAQVRLALEEHSAKARPWDQLAIEIVPENQVRAKANCTRVFIPVNTDVFRFYDNLGKWFLHFSEPELLQSCILPKSNRNLEEGRKTAVIYRRGVRVREFESDDTPSLFDYNLNSLQLDESRKVDDWYVTHYAAAALSNAEPKYLAMVIRATRAGMYWENNFPSHGLEPNYNDTPEILRARSNRWTEACALLGENVVFCSEGEADRVRAKGYDAVVVGEGFLLASRRYGVRTALDVLSNDELAGRQVVSPTASVTHILSVVWDVLTELQLTREKSIPDAHCFATIMVGGVLQRGYQRDNGIFIASNIADGVSVDLIQTILEEVAHYVTGSTDNSRDFQDYAFLIAAKLFANRV